MGMLLRCGLSLLNKDRQSFCASSQTHAATCNNVNDGIAP